MESAERTARWPRSAMAGVPYVGSGPRAGALAMDKWATKLVAGAVGIATAPGGWWTAGASGTALLRGTSGGQAGGRRVQPTACRLVDARRRGPRSRADAALALDDRALVEERVVGREIDVAVIGDPHGSRLGLTRVGGRRRAGCSTTPRSTPARRLPRPRAA